MRKLVLLGALAVLAFTLVPVASTATTTTTWIAYTDANGSLSLATSAAAGAKTLVDNSTAAGPGAVQALALAPDGKNVLVLASDTSSLALVPVAGGSPTAIGGTDGATSGGFSPDGTSVVFATSAGISTVSTAGGTPQQIVATPAGATDTLPVYSPNGKQIAFARDATDADGNETTTLELATVGTTTVKDLTTGVLTDLAAGGRISFSPDGKTLVFAGSYDNPGIFTVPAAGGTSSRLTTDTDLWPSFTPDGASILFSRDANSTNADDQQATPAKPSDNDVYELWTMAANGGNPTVVAEGDYETLAVTPASASPPTTTSSSAGRGKITVTVAVSGTRYTVSWTGKAAGWKVTLKVGKTTATATVKGSVHSHTFVVKAKGAVSATVVATR